MSPALACEKALLRMRVRLVDRHGSTVGVAFVADEIACFGGMIDLCGASADLLALFAEFEEIVNGQMFAFLDEVQAKIGAVGAQVVFEDGERMAIHDLQVFPSTREVSFRTAGVFLDDAAPPRLQEVPSGS